MAYWWASQSTNWKVVIDEGTLWAGANPAGTDRSDWVRLTELARGDIVFHYGGQAIRAVSRVSSAAEDAPRPAVGYTSKGRPQDFDHGWLVRVEPTHRGLSLPGRRAAQIVHAGSPGPFDRTGRPGRRFISTLTDSEGSALLAELGIAEVAESVLGLPAPEGAGPTDAAALATVRTEQRELRRHLLHGRAEAPCALCGRRLPEQLLVAAHIAPRRELTDAERRRFDEVAMLACALGCDALFEWGHVSVDETGTIVAGPAAATGDLAAAVRGLVGRPCSAHGPATASMFARRRTGFSQAGQPG
ncbi:hypothetical protein CHO01_21820 [Cellulomonas hominis]|uniref:HNH nuclease domain-containing protein n=1 Tax=Cellulomonas hominis TaxID=156981 RepID=A0A511FCT7_9CELL|nr:hypothetical protein [Cellulomonas hominis]MBB5474695.1 hypothetical protein [Cellulomonas hominis]NKY05760.1 HNH endonuclease [Cellulomonas hominis]GEL47066.1 hypothetical protein CHO01_21820 [Cellulomonas hominis]